MKQLHTERVSRQSPQASTLRQLALVGMSCLVAFMGGCGDGSSDPIARIPAKDAVTCVVDTTQVIRTVPRGLFGTNLEWFNFADGISAPDGSIRPGWVELARAQGVDNIRFPGGTLSDYYHWQDGIGPQEHRPVREHPTDSGKSPNVFGTPEFLRFCQAVGAQPLITVNAGTGTAAEAAEWVAYCNQKDNPDRQRDGLLQPVPVHLWEIGNELYLPGNPTDKSVITVSPETYAERFLAFSAAMRKADPSIKLMAIGTANSSQVALPYPDWTEIVLARAAPEIDLYAVHNAYFPMTFIQHGVPTKDLYQSLWAAPEAVARSLTKLSGLLARYEKSRHIEIAITEWGALFSYEKTEVDQVKTMGSAVYLARLLQVFLSQPRVTVADYFKFTDRSFMGWIGYDQKPKIPYYVIELFSKHFGSQLVHASVNSPEFDSKAVGIAAAEHGVPELTVAAALDDTGKKLFINIVNRSWNTIHRIKLDTGGFTPAPTAKTWTISSPGVTDHNGPDLPGEINPSLYVEPKLSAGFKGPIAITTGICSSADTFPIAPFSVLTIELESHE